MKNPISYLKGRIVTAQAKELVAQAQRLNVAGEWAEAEELSRQALALAPGHPLPHDSLGHAISRNGEYWHNPDLVRQMVADGRMTEMVRCWRNALSLGLESHWTEFQLAYALTAIGEQDDAVPHLERATDLRLAKHRPVHVAQHGVSGERRGPDFLIIGATKCGTTALHEYIFAHPHALPPINKEIEYFRFPGRGLAWYMAHFPRIPAAGERFVTGESSSCYLSIWDCKERVKAAFPAARLIALVRDPVARTISHFHHDTKINCEHRSLELALNTELDILEGLDDPFHQASEYWQTQRGYVWLSLYSYMIDNWLTEFPREQLKVVVSEDLFADPDSVVADVLQHIGLSSMHGMNFKPVFQGKYARPSEVDAIVARLSRFFAPHNRRLAELLGRRLDWL